MGYMAAMRQSIVLVAFVLVGAAATLTGLPAWAQTTGVQNQKQVVQRSAARPQTSWEALRERTNQNVVTVISGNTNGTYLYFAYDLSAVLDNGDDLRVLPIIGKGGYQNVKDILHLKGVDLGITQSNIMSYLKRTGEFGNSINDRLAYVAKLYNEEMHILAGPGINDIKDLHGKTVNFSDVGSGTQFSTRLIFELLGIKATEVNMGQADGYEKVKSGEIAATVLIAGKPSGAFAKFKLEAGMKLLPIPYTEALEADYFPAKLTNADYPNLIAADKPIDTVAVGAVLAVYNWPRDTERYRRVSKFVDAFFARFEEFKKKPRHPKWKEANLAGVVKGWKRFPSAQEWLDRNATAAVPAVAATAAVAPPPGVDLALAREQAQRAAPGNPAEQERLFQRFIEWSRQQKR
jgi:TRAP transporter TAXI family solute receptor